MSEVAETEVVEEVDVMQEAIDSFNDDIDTPVDTDDFDTPIEEEVKEESTEADEKPVESEEVEEATEEVKEETAEELYTLKHFDGDKEVSLKEMQDLAQMGMDRDRIVTQRDEARNDPRLVVADRINKLSELYEYGDVNKLVDALYNSFDEQQGNEIGTTNNKIKNETETAIAQAKEEADKPYNDFVEKFPNVKADDIPQEVWNKVNSGESILTAYESYVEASKELETTKKESEQAKEVEALKAELAILKKNNENKTKTKTGSIEGKSDGNTQEAYLDIWDK